MDMQLICFMLIWSESSHFRIQDLWKHWSPPVTPVTSYDIAHTWKVVSDGQIPCGLKQDVESEVMLSQFKRSPEMTIATFPPEWWGVYIPPLQRWKQLPDAQNFHLCSFPPSPLSHNWKGLLAPPLPIHIHDGDPRGWGEFVLHRFICRLNSLLSLWHTSDVTAKVHCSLHLFNEPSENNRPMKRWNYPIKASYVKLQTSSGQPTVGASIVCDRLWERRKC